MRTAEIALADQQLNDLVVELRSYQPDLDCICCSDADLVRAVERARARTRDDRERG